MKNYKSILDCMHAFASRNEIEGQASSVFFYGNKIYSYGYHYLLGEFHYINGETIILINDKGYSVTTAKHIRMLINATRQYKQYYTTDVDPKNVYTAIQDSYKKLMVAKKQEKYIVEIQYRWDRFMLSPFHIDTTDERYKKTLKIVETVKAKNDDLANEIEAYKALIKRQKEAKQQEAQEQIARFRTYKVNAINHHLDFLRVSICGNYIETSQSVKIPIEEARRVYQNITDGINIAGQQIAGFQVRSIDEKMLKVGCHHIELTEIHNVMKTTTI